VLHLSVIRDHLILGKCKKNVVPYWHQLVLVANVYLGCANDSENYTEFHMSFKSPWKWWILWEWQKVFNFKEKPRRHKMVKSFGALSVMQSASVCAVFCYFTIFTI